MAKRFTDSDLWKTQRWFRKLKPLEKLVFCYIKDQCNHAGIWKVDCSDLIDDLGIEDFNLPDFVSAVNAEYDKISGSKILKERLLIIQNNQLWLTGFIQYQYEGKDGKVNPLAAPVRTALIILEGLGTLTQALDKGYLKLTQDLQEGWRRPKEKDKDMYSNNRKHLVKNSENGKSKNEHFSGNYKAQGEELLGNRLRNGIEDETDFGAKKSN